MKKILAFLITFALCIYGSGEAAAASTSTQTSQPTEAPIESDPARMAEPIPAATRFAGGSGTENDPYQIATAGQLAYMSQICGDMSDHSIWDYVQAYYVLIDDIALNDTSDFDSWGTNAPQWQWTPIAERSPAFCGHFDGQGHTISGMYIYDTRKGDGSSGGLGLFGNVDNATIQDLTITMSYIAADGAYVSAGSFSGEMSNSRMIRCKSDAVIEYPYAGNCGGLVGEVLDSSDKEGLIQDCEFNGKLMVSAYPTVGGLIGDALALREMRDCRCNGEIIELDATDYRAYIGGLIGKLSAGNSTIIDSCENEADIRLTDGQIGGLFGYLFVGLEKSNGKIIPDYLLIKNCKNSGDIFVEADSSYPIGGIAGGVYSGSCRSGQALYEASLEIVSCINTGDLSGNTAGGIMGEVSANCKWLFSNCINEGDIHAQKEAGGIVARASTSDNGAEITGCENRGSVYSETVSSAGIVGDANGMNILDSTNAMPLHISECSNSGSISGGDTISGFGGIVGGIRGVEAPIYIERCFNEGEITGGKSCRLGGILGDTSFADISGYKQDCFYVTNCVNHGVLKERKGNVLFTEALREDCESEGTNNNYTYLMSLGGTCIGGIVGFCKGGKVSMCVNMAEIWVDSKSTVPFTPQDVNRGVENEAEHIVFCGGICGIYFYTTKASQGTSLVDCLYSEPIPIGCFVSQEEYKIQNVKQVPLAEAEEWAGELLK